MEQQNVGLEITELIMDCEEAYYVSLPSNPLSNCKSLGDLHSLLIETSRRQSPVQGIDSSWCHFAKIIIRHTSANMSELTPETLFRDLW